MENTNKKQYALIKLEKYANFESVHEMDKTVKEYNKKLTKPLYATLNLLKQHSCKIVGVSHIKIETIAKKLNKSRTTVKRHIKYLKDYGYITVGDTLRPKKGGQGANFYIINTFEQREKIIKSNNNGPAQTNHRKTSKDSGQTQSQRAFGLIAARKQTIKSLNLLKTFIGTRKVKLSNKLKRIKNIQNYRACPEGVAEHVYLAYKPFFTDKQIEVLYDISLNKLVPFEFPREYDEQIIDKAFRTLLLKLKKEYNGMGEKVKNMFSYFSAVICRQANEFKDSIQFSNFKENGEIINDSLIEIGPVPAWLNNRNDNHDDMEYDPELEKEKATLLREIELFCNA